jgi:hypothetical protein
MMEERETTILEPPMITNDKKILNETKEPLLDLVKCSLYELINFLQKFFNDPPIIFHQAGFRYYIANYAIKERIKIYNNEDMIPQKLRYAWLPKILITIGKETHHAILDLGSIVFVLSKELYDLLELKTMEKCSIDLLLTDHSTKHALGKVNYIMIELHMTSVHVDFVIMDMGTNTYSPIIIGRTFLRTTSAIINSEEGNVKFQFPHKKCIEHFKGRRR